MIGEFPGAPRYEEAVTFTHGPFHLPTWTSREYRASTSAEVVMTVSGGPSITEIRSRQADREQLIQYLTFCPSRGQLIYHSH